jgi:cysteine desulfurase
MSLDRTVSRGIYLDYAASTPVRPEVREAVLPFLGEERFGNPSSGHARGRSARAALDGARRSIAEAMGCEPPDVLFTSGGTEADNLAVLGGALRARADGRPFRVAVGSTEHKAVLDAAHAVEQLGGEAILLPVDALGQVRREAVSSALQRGLALMSVMWVNNETGVIQDVAALAEQAGGTDTPFHTDAVQAVGKVACRIEGTGITMVTISGHKIGAPKGVGALVLRRRDAVAPLIHGGGQQGGIRPGTENVAGAVGLGLAVELAVREREVRMPGVRALRERLETLLSRALPGARITAADADRAPHITNVTLPGVDGNALLVHLDQAGIYCSAGSACATGSSVPSHVLTAMGMPGERAGSSLRFSLCAATTEQEIERSMAALPEIVSRVRALTEALRR